MIEKIDMDALEHKQLVSNAYEQCLDKFCEGEDNKEEEGDILR